mmetsp:Transcript_33184/g.50853  ORF Transcript_33184/g.50853 Transcript_33184/m.50853 type:complete len:125 (-) Transcript_33184:70-444(-)
MKLCSLALLLASAAADTPPVDSTCKLWNDGCNDCTRDAPGDYFSCTEMYCNPDFEGGCLEDFSGQTWASVADYQTWASQNPTEAEAIKAPVIAPSGSESPSGSSGSMTLGLSASAAAIIVLLLE